MRFTAESGSMSMMEYSPVGSIALWGVYPKGGLAHVVSSSERINAFPTRRMRTDFYSDGTMPDYKILLQTLNGGMYMKKSIIALTLIMALVLPLIPCVGFAASEIAVGDYVVMGRYMGHSIVWRCIANDDNGYLMLSDKILTLKCFDPAGEKTTDNYNTRVNAGSDYWPESSLRRWLNSDDDVVRYASGHVPNAASVKDGINPYDSERGFLNESNFTKEEVALMVETDVASVVSHNEKDRATLGEYLHQYKSPISKSLANYERSYRVTATDKMFLPSVAELAAIYTDSTLAADTFYVGFPTQRTISEADALYDELSTDRPYYYWTRDAMSFSTGEHVRTVAALSPKYIPEAFAKDPFIPKGESRIESTLAYNGSIGVRPAFYLTKDVVASKGDGTKANPFAIKTSAVALRISSDFQSAVTGAVVDFNIFTENIPTDATLKYIYNGEPVASNKGLVLDRPENSFVVSLMHNGTEMARDEAIVRTANYAGAEAAFIEEFEGTDTPPANLVGDWSAAYSRYENALDGQAIKFISSNGAGVRFKNTKIAGKKGTVVVEASIAFDDFNFTDGSPIFTLKGKRKSDGTPFEISPLVASVNKAIALAGTESNKSVFTSILPGERLDVRLIVNINAGTVSVMVNDVGCASNVKLNMTDFDSFDELVVGSLNTANATSSYVMDNLSVKTMSAESVLGYVRDEKGLKIYNPLGVTGDAIVYLALDGEVISKENITLSATEDVYLTLPKTDINIDKFSVYVWTPNGMVPYDISRKIGW